MGREQARGTTLVAGRVDHVAPQGCRLGRVEPRGCHQFLADHIGFAFLFARIGQQHADLGAGAEQVKQYVALLGEALRPA